MGTVRGRLRHRACGRREWWRRRAHGHAAFSLITSRSKRSTAKKRREEGAGGRAVWIVDCAADDCVAASTVFMP